MTINGGRPHAVGDRGQRYEITYFDGRAAERRTLGWCQTREQAEMVVLRMSGHPVWSGFEIVDRHEPPNDQGKRTPEARSAVGGPLDPPVVPL